MTAPGQLLALCAEEGSLAAMAAVKVLEELSIVTERTGQQKNRSYSYTAYIALLAE